MRRSPASGPTGAFRHPKSAAGSELARIRSLADRTDCTCRLGNHPSFDVTNRKHARSGPSLRSCRYTKRGRVRSRLPRATRSPSASHFGAPRAVGRSAIREQQTLPFAERRRDREGRIARSIANVPTSGARPAPGMSLRYELAIISVRPILMPNPAASEPSSVEIGATPAPAHQPSELCCGTGRAR